MKHAIQGHETSNIIQFSVIIHHWLFKVSISHVR